MISYSRINSTNQPERKPECITIGKLAPDFIALSTQGYIRMSDYRGEWVIIYSQPMAFTSVATTELIAAALSYPELQKRNAVIIGLTTDNVYSNLAWVYDIYQKTGVVIPFPIIGDADLVISEKYGMLNPDRLYGESVRDAFIINPSGIIRAIITLPTSCGRSIEELLRIIDSLQITEKYNLQTPSGWKQGNPVVEPTPTSFNEIINRVNTGESQGMLCPFWYLCYTNLPTEDNSNNAEPSASNNEATK